MSIFIAVYPPNIVDIIYKKVASFLLTEVGYFPKEE